MDASNLSAIQAQLEQEKSQLATQADQLRAELATLDEHLARIDAALAALSGQRTARPAAKATKPQERKKLTAPSPKKSDVVQVVRELLGQHGVVEAEDLKRQVEKKLVAAGFSRMGLAMRFSEALQEREFVDTPAGVRLKEEKRATAKV